MYFSRLNYKYFQVYPEIIKHVIWLGIKIEINMVLGFYVKKYDKNIFNQELSKIIMNESRCKYMSYFIKVGASR